MIETSSDLLRSSSASFGKFRKCSPGLRKKFGNLRKVVGILRKIFKTPLLVLPSWRRGGLMVGVLDFGASGPGSSTSRGHCTVFLGKTLYSYSASLHPGV